MTHYDYRNCAITGATPDALASFERGLADLLAWRGAPCASFRQALEASRGFVMAYIALAHFHLCSRDVTNVAEARRIRAQTPQRRANARERMHLAAIDAALAGDYTQARTVLGMLLGEFPRDTLALAVVHSFDYLTGDIEQLDRRVAAAQAAWSAELPGYHAVLAMRAFGLSECGEPARATAIAEHALALNPLDARAHHVMAHVHDAQRNAEAGIRWLRATADGWSGDTFAATHCWWHLALFHLDAGDTATALRLYDERIGGKRPTAVPDLIDGAALLWRLMLRGAHALDRWQALAALWEPHLEDRFCAFNDLHAMIAFVGATRWDLADRLVRALAEPWPRTPDYDAMNRLVGLPACRALLAFGRGDDAAAIGLLGTLPAVAHRIGGSHAQRDVMHLTLLAAVERVRRAPYAMRRAA
jgi:tetratricopeptide (TPR) repeat protein